MYSVVLYGKENGVADRGFMPFRYPAVTVEAHGSYGVHVVDHLTADGTSLTGGDVTVVTVVEVDAYFVCSFHLELIKSRAGSRNCVLFAVSHFLNSL